MATGSTISQASSVLKQMYPQKRVTSATLEDNTLMDMLTKDTTHQGEHRKLPILYGGGQGHGTTVAGAQANSSNSLTVNALYDVGQYFSKIDINDKTMLAARSDMGSFIRIKTMEMDEINRQHGNDMSIQTWGNGGASLGQISGISSVTVTMSNLTDIKNIEVGMRLTASDDDGSLVGHTQLDTADTMTVATVNYLNGTFTVASADIAGLGANDYLFRANAFAGDISQADIMKGIQAHCTSSAPTTALHNITRTTHSRLHGIVAPASIVETGNNYQERFEEFASYAQDAFGSTPRHFFVSPRHWVRISRQLQNTGYRILDGGAKNERGSFGYDSIEFQTSYGKAQILTDRHCPTTRAYALDMKHIKLISMGEMSHVMDRDGLTILRAATTNDYEMRFASYAEVEVDKPCAHGSFALPAL